MNLFQTVFTDFNPSKFVVYTALFFFSLFFALRADGFILWSYWFVFIPLWLWKGIVFFGAVVGVIVWVFRRNESPRSTTPSMDGEVNNLPNNGAGQLTSGITATNRHFKAMLMAFSTQMLLLVFEVLACDKLESAPENSLKWIVVFSPLIFISILSVFICIWSIKNDRSLEAGNHRMAIPGSQPLPSFSIQMELICSINILQFIFVALRLDLFLDWRWSVVFIPVWIVMFLALIVVLYSMILACLLMRSPDMINQQRRGNVNAALGNFFFIVPLLVFEIMLTKKLDFQYGISLDGSTPHPHKPFLYTSVVFPLLVSFLTLLFTSVGRRGGNPWWCGFRKDFCSFLVLNLCPMLQEYGNISYQVHFDDEVSDDLDSTVSTVQGTLSPSASYESGRPPSIHPYQQPIPSTVSAVIDPTSPSFPSGLSRSFSSRLFKFKKKNMPPAKSTPVVPVLYLDMPD